MEAYKKSRFVKIDTKHKSKYKKKRFDIKQREKVQV